MPRVPFVGRLSLRDYVALITSFALLALEVIIRTITLLLPGPIVRWFYRASRNAFNRLSSPASRHSRNRKKAVSSPIAQANDFLDLCDLYGYTAEEHIVQTGDGYLLGVHRLGYKRGEEDQKVNAGPGSVQKKVVYLHHGLMMNSEVWVCLTERERCLPFMLVEQGFDVWLGNNRGNKYSKKSLHTTPDKIAFWSFSMDQFAFHDIPDTIDYVLSTTKQPSLSYIGFSQGTAQAFATLSIHPMLNEKVDVFVALAPAMAPPGLAGGIVASLVKSSPEILYLAFGRRAIFGSATMWQALLYPAIFTWFIDKSLSFLFGWHTNNITAHQKMAAYPHLYSFSSVKTVVHWFQIIRHGTFQMFDDEGSSPLAVGKGSKYYKIAKFPTRNIKTPIVLVYGGSDSLVDIELMLRELPRHTVAKCIKKYEHLDLLWAHDVAELVFPHVLEALQTYAMPAGGPQKSWKAIDCAINDRQSLGANGSSTLEGSGSDRSLRLITQDQRLRQAYDWGLDSSTPDEQLDESEGDEKADDGPERFALSPTPKAPSLLAALQTPERNHVRNSSALDAHTAETTRRRITSPRQLHPETLLTMPLRRSSIPTRSSNTQQATPQSSNSRPQTPVRSSHRRIGSLPVSYIPSIASPTSPVTAQAKSEATVRGAPRPTRPEGWWSSTSESTAESSPTRTKTEAVETSLWEGRDVGLVEDGDGRRRKGIGDRRGGG